MFGRDGEVYEEHEEDSEFACYSIHIAGIEAKSKAKAKAEIVHNCLKEGLSIPLISRLTGLSEKEIEKIAIS